ncbi:hypothetical protein B0H11DRAFT_1295737 [Mycena galericulata]|nr:hypothetical protein B0H11DRAFT_1295737 [Mycena galericulata]
MNTIPPEMWAEVFAFACTDDGHTGRALSMVSRAVQVISKPLKYQSIGVVGLHQLLKLVKMLTDLTPGGRKVKYLFVAGMDESRSYENPAGSGRFRIAPRTDIAEQALSRLLHLVSSSLLALHIHHTVPRQSLLPETDLTELTQLTICGPFKPSQPTDHRPPRIFPSLRRIRIHHFAFHPENFLEQILHAAPVLTHLRVPQCSFTPYDIQAALGILQPIAPASEVVYLPDTLERLVIEVEGVPSSLDSCAGNIRASQFLRKFQKISLSDGRVSLIDGRSDWIPVIQAKEEWLENRRGS